MSPWTRVWVGIGSFGLCAGIIFAGLALFAERCAFDRPCPPTSTFDVRDFKSLFSWMPSMATAQDGKLIVLGGDLTKRDWTGNPLISARLFDPETGDTQEVYELQLRYPAMATLLSPDSRQVAIFCYTPVFPPRCLNEQSSGMIVNLADGTVVEELNGPQQPAAELFDLPDTFTDQSRTVPGTDLFVHATRPDGELVFSSLGDGSEQYRLQLEHASRPLEFVSVEPSPDGTKLAILQMYHGDRNNLSVIERADGRVLAHFEVRYGTKHVSWTDDSARIVTARGLFRDGTDITEFSVFDLAQ